MAKLQRSKPPSEAMERVLAYAPTKWLRAPVRIYGYPGSGNDFAVRSRTLWGLEERGLIQLKLRGSIRRRVGLYWRRTPD